MNKLRCFKQIELNNPALLCNIPLALYDTSHFKIYDNKFALLSCGLHDDLTHINTNQTKQSQR